MGLDFVRIECEVIADQSAQLTAALYSVARNFEAVFKSLCCTAMQENCGGCRQRSGCSYWNVFNRELSSDPEIVRLHQKPSVPFSLYIPEAGVQALPCRAGIVVVGSATNYIEVFHAALLRVVESGVRTCLQHTSYTLRSCSVDHQGIRHEIAHAAPLREGLILLSAEHILHNSVHCDQARLSLLSPLRMVSNGSIAHRFDFAMFFRSQLRRCSSMCAYYGSGELDLDYQQLSKSAQKVTVFDDTIQYTQPGWSTRQSRAGLTGSVECAALVEPMFSLLLLGSFFNAGKGAAYGSGFHQIEAL